MPGARLPHAWVGDSRRKLSTLDLAPFTRFTLVTGIAGEAWVSAAEKVGHDLGVPLEAVVIRPGREVTDIYFDWARLREVARRRAAGAAGQAHRLALARFRPSGGGAARGDDVAAVPGAAVRGRGEPVARAALEAEGRLMGMRFVHEVRRSGCALARAWPRKWWRRRSSGWARRR